MKTLIFSLILLLYYPNYIITSAQDLPIKGFVNIYLNFKDYYISKFQIDTLRENKIGFLNKLKAINPSDYGTLKDNMDLNQTSFPQEFIITDLDKDGNKEYTITENYEGVFSVMYTFKNNKWKNLFKVPISGCLVESPQKIWLTTGDSYLAWERDFNLLGMQTLVYSLNLIDGEFKPEFKIYCALQNMGKDDEEKWVHLMEPSEILNPKKFIVKVPTRFYTNCYLPQNAKSNGIIQQGSLGWILGDTLNAYFTVFYNHTRFENDSLGYSKLTTDDKGYLFCWIPKNAVDFSIENGISNIYQDNKTKEYLRFFETSEKLNVSYFTPNSFEKNLRVISYDKAGKKVVVKFQNSEKSYLLELKENNKRVYCTNPDGTQQIFDLI